VTTVTESRGSLASSWHASVKLALSVNVLRSTLAGCLLLSTATMGPEVELHVEVKYTSPKFRQIEAALRMGLPTVAQLVRQDLDILEIPRPKVRFMRVVVPNSVEFYWITELNSVCPSLSSPLHVASHTSSSSSTKLSRKEFLSTAMASLVYQCEPLLPEALCMS
jgi:hypothetical protein